MNNKILQFEVSSPPELQGALAAHQFVGGACLAEVRVFGGTIHTWPFSFPKCSSKKLIAGLKFDASEIFSVRPGDVEISYKIFNKENARIHGICSAMKQQDLAKYWTSFQSRPIVVLSLTASAVSAPLDILKEQKYTGLNSCIINFLRPHMVNITVFAGHNPVLFRELNNISDEDLENKIHDTLRYAQSHSQSKQINHVYFTGDLKGKEPLIKNIKALEVPGKDDDLSLQRELVQAPNLLEKYVLNAQTRSMLLRVFIIIGIASLAAGVLLAAHFFKTRAQLQETQKMFNKGDYLKALELQEQLRRINHAQ